jgi:hypothetical protein
MLSQLPAIQVLAMSCCSYCTQLAADGCSIPGQLPCLSNVFVLWLSLIVTICYDHCVPEWGEADGLWIACMYAWMLLYSQLSLHVQLLQSVLLLLLFMLFMSNRLT